MFGFKAYYEEDKSTGTPVYRTRKAFSFLLLILQFLVLATVQTLHYFKPILYNFNNHQEIPKKNK